MKNADCIIVAVAHDEFKGLDLDTIKGLYRESLTDNQKVLIDVKSIYNIADLRDSGLSYWRLCLRFFGIFYNRKCKKIYNSMRRKTK